MVEAFAFEKAKLLSRELRRGMGKIAHKCYDYVSPSKTEYKLCITTTRRKWYVRCYVYCMELNQYIVFMLYPDEKRIVRFSYALTPHFLRRYAERYLHRSDMSINAMLSAYSSLRTDLFLIYHKGNNAVFASDRGLMFGNLDNKRNIFVQRTFVSVDMLKTSQLSVYRKILELHKDNTWAAGIDDEVYSADVFFAECQKRGIDVGLLYQEYDEYFRKHEQKKLFTSKGKSV